MFLAAAVVVVEETAVPDFEQMPELISFCSETSEKQEKCLN
jgi:hypothetical protein